jgi:hypothetical protein
MRAVLLASATAANFGDLRLGVRQAKATAAALSMLDHGGSSDHQHTAQSFVAGSGDTAEPDLARSRMVFWRQADPGRELACGSEKPGLRGLHFQQHRADRADAGDLGEPSAAFIGAMPRDEPGTRWTTVSGS